MKITRVEAIEMSLPYRYGGPQPASAQQSWARINVLLVRVETDGGITGWGEAFGFTACPVTRAALETLVAPLAIGRDPTDNAALMEDLRFKLHLFGRGPTAFALSGLDIALWDIRGKAEGKPVSALIGGAKHAELPSYASLLRYGDPDQAAAATVDAVERGHIEVKLHEARVSEVAAARKAVGPDVPLMLDVNCRWSEEQGLAIAHELKPYNLKWLEEPVWPADAHETFRRINDEAGVPIAAGENAPAYADFERLIDLGKASYLQPSATKAGGLSELMRIGQLADARGVTINPHSAYFGPGLAATVHYLATRERPILEWYDCRFETDPFGGGLRPVKGRVAVPDAPGLGITIDEDVVARYRVS